MITLLLEFSPEIRPKKLHPPIYYVRLYVTINDFSKVLYRNIFTIFIVPIGISTPSAKIIVFTQSTDIEFPIKITRITVSIVFIITSIKEQVNE